MTIHLNIDYRTLPGEMLVVNIPTLSLDGKGGCEKRTMTTTDGNRWTASIELKVISDIPSLPYFYSVERSGHVERHEWLNAAHVLEASFQKAKHVEVYDHWIDIPEDAYLYSSAFTQCVQRREQQPVKATSFAKTIRLKVRAPQLRSAERLAVVGDAPVVGQWDVLKAVDMTEHMCNEWVVDIDAAQLSGKTLSFKFAALDAVRDVTPLWENGDNRTIQVPELHDGDVVVYELSQAYFSIYPAKFAGTLVPVFSLRTKESFGVGDFGDLKQMIDYVASTGQRVLQVLPINDTTTTHTWVDSYPYSCISVFALHPQYCDLRQLPPLKDKKLELKFRELGRKLNALPQIDYEAVNDAKTEYLKAIFAQEGRRMMEEREFKEFLKSASDWLVPYAQFCYLRDKYGTADYQSWPDHKQWDEADRKTLTATNHKDFKAVAFYYFVQYVLNTQMKTVHEYARAKHVILKGDIPIGVSRYGCDVWSKPDYFHLDGQAGAPPDAFSVNGQNWGFPTYNWEAMLADGCAWWAQRLQCMSQYFDAYRIDHVLGFFRIWEIPVSCVNGLLGQFSPALPLSREDIESYGLHFQEELFTRPFIADWVIDRVFHEYADEVKATYLVHEHDDIWQLKPEYDTERKVEKVFEGKTSVKDITLRDGLYALIDDVLFVRDKQDANKFHPRITAQLDFMYEALYDSDKAAFNRLYDDYYYRRNNDFWYGQAMRKLPRLVQSTNMLVCAEDLGMVPDCVPSVMDNLRILSLEIQSMPKDSKVRFGHLSRNPYRSVATISTHDMPTLRQWWDEDWNRTQEYYNTMLYRSGAAPHPLPGWLASDIVSRHLTSPSMLCILSIQDWLAMDERLRLKDENAERINVPAEAHHYWRYRMHVNIEDLMNNRSFCESVRELVVESGR